MENLVGFVKGSFFKQRRFHDVADLRAQLAEWHREVNDERPCRNYRIECGEYWAHPLQECPWKCRERSKASRSPLTAVRNATPLLKIGMLRCG